MWVGNRVGLVVVCSLLTAVSSFAQEPGTAARLGMGARPLALAGAFVAIPDDATAVFWNPAGLTTVSGTRVQLHYRRVTAAHALDSGSIVFGPPRHRMVWGVSVNVMHRAGVAADDALGSFSGEPGASEFSGQVSLALQAHPSLSLGFSAGPILSSLQTQGDRRVGWGGNAGLLWRQAGTSLGFGVLGITAGLGTPLDPQAYRYRLSTGLSQRLGAWLLSMQMDRDRGADPSLSSGLEWTVVKALRLRAGLQSPFAQNTATEVFSNGLGVQSGRFQMDYAVRYGKEFSPEHLLTLRFQLGEPAVPVQQQREEPPMAATTEAQAAAPAALSEPPEEAALPVVPSEAAVRATADVGAPETRRPLQEGPSHPQHLPVVAHDGLPPAPRPGAPTPMTVPTSGTVRYVVRAGVHSDMDSAALEIARFYRAEIRPNLERRGDLYIVVVKRCEKLSEARAWQARVRSAGLRCSIDEE